MISCKIPIQSSIETFFNLSNTLTNCVRYDFEYEDDDDEETGDVGIENKYYNAKQMKVDNPDEAVDEFLGIPAMEEEKGDWYKIEIFSLPRAILICCTSGGSRV